MGTAAPEVKMSGYSTILPTPWAAPVARKREASR